MSDAFLIIVDGSTQVGFFLPALVTHEEVEIWAGGKEVENTRDLDDEDLSEDLDDEDLSEDQDEEVDEKTQDLDHWREIAERKAARQAKIVAVPLAEFKTCARFIFWS